MPKEAIDMYNEFGKIGWQYFGEQILTDNLNLTTYIILQNNKRALLKIIREHEPTVEQAMFKYDKLQKLPNFTTRIIHDFDRLKTTVEKSYGIRNKKPLN